MTMREPFLLIPWDTDFLSRFKEVILEVSDGRPGDAAVVFMNDRPRRYLTHLFRTDPAIPRPCLLPHMLTAAELFSALREEQDRRNRGLVVPRREAGLPDRAALIGECVRELAASEPQLCRTLADTDEAAFFPWAVRLADLMEECFTQCLEPEDLHHTEPEASPFAAVLLGALGRLYRLYREKLEAGNLITPGFGACLAASRLSDDTLPIRLRGRKILLAGFNALTGSEERVFRFLWERGARFCLHLDPAVLHRREGAVPHWSCSEQIRLIETWGAEVRAVCGPSGRVPQVHFFAGYDLHSQLRALQEDLATRPPGPGRSTAVVLTHEGMLSPVLRHLPDTECNISLGRPLEDSLMFRLLEAVLETRDLMRADGTVHRRVLAALIRHPYLRLLRSGNTALRGMLQEAEHLLRSGPRFAEPRTVFRTALAAAAHESGAAGHDPSDAEAARRLADTVLRRTVEDWAAAETLEQTAEALAGLCSLPAEHADRFQERFPLDAECLFRILQRVVPALRVNALARTVLPWSVRKTLLLELIRAERVPFEADPLTGLQVLGMLETRLLSFDRVAVLDVTDDRLPGAPSRNPLLPDSLRRVLGLPDADRRDCLAAYTFHRLLACSREVDLYWQEGVQSSGLFEGKKQRSRFVEELIWREERRRGKLLAPGEAPLRAARPHIRPPERRRIAVPRSPDMRARMQELLSQPCSPSLLEAYLVCPLRFYYERVCGFGTPPSLADEDDPAAVGDLVHEVLRDFYAPRLGTIVEKDALCESELRALFAARLRHSGLSASLPPESAVMLAAAGPERLGRFLKNQPERTEILHLEARFEADLDVHGRTRRLAGLLDRVDRRDLGIVILDYKTGRLKTWNESAFGDDALWEAVAGALRDGPDAAAITDPDRDLLPVLAARTPGLQLPFYMYVYTRATGRAVRDAAYAALAEDGTERPLLRDAPEDLRTRLTGERFPDLLRFVLLHMEHCPEFRPGEGRHCDWCLFDSLCIL